MPDEQEYGRRYRINVELPTKKHKEMIDLLPVGIKGRILARLCMRLALYVEEGGWQSVLWLCDNEVEFVPKEKEVRYEPGRVHDEG